ncbi:hypothetical protein S40288_05458 [Stachybotrys chartarum IBT 40288]|nr:hypothetical protein S40288_05458 [Stachybotrys chartarum IBT 40288]
MVQFYKPVPAAAILGALVAPRDLDIENPNSIRNVASTIAYDAMTYYNGNTSSNPVQVGDLEDPYYWWVAGSLWGTMLDYYHFTGDATYNDVIIEALLAPSNTGPEFNYMPEEHAFEEGNDDLFFWGSAVLAAAERNFPQPIQGIPPWLDIGANVFNELASRWNTTHCGGGLLWQIFASNPNGLDYKNSVSNGGFFQIAARMARATGNPTYLEWAERIWDWSFNVGFIDAEEYHVYDGAHASNNCEDTNRASFTYTSGIYLHGAAVLANYTGNSIWAERASRLLDGAGWFFGPFENSTNVLYERACERENDCSVDMSTHKGQLARFLWQATVMQPALRERVEEYMFPSAMAAAQSCTGGRNGFRCGLRWYVDGYDGSTGLGQQSCALEVIQGLLIHQAPAPLPAGEIRHATDRTW